MAESFNASGNVVELVINVSLSIIGTTGNIFQISSVMSDDTLNHRGNALLVSLALSNMLVTSVGLPAMWVAILSGSPHNLLACYFLWYAALLCFLITVANFFFIGVENMIRFCSKNADQSASLYDRLFGDISIAAMMTSIWAVPIIWVSLMEACGCGPNFCTMVFGGGIYLYVTVVPLLASLICLITGLMKLQNDIKDINAQNYCVSAQKASEHSLIKGNFVMFLYSMCCWVPYIGLTGLLVDDISHELLIRRLFWVALSSCCLSSWVLAIANANFRRSYSNLFGYVFFKRSISSRSDHVEMGNMQQPVRVRIGAGMAGMFMNRNKAGAASSGPTLL